MSFHIRKDFCAHIFEKYFNVRRFYMSETLLNGTKRREKKQQQLRYVKEGNSSYLCDTVHQG